MWRVRIDDRAFFNLSRHWWNAGILDTAGPVMHPEPGTPQGGTVSPVLAQVSVHEALARWFDNVVKAHCGGEARLCR
jgi:retron-type reverse transcriptase